MIKKQLDKRVVFISSTGGHLTELLQLKELFDCFDSYIITEKMAINNWLKKKYKAYFLLYGARNYPLIYVFKFVINTILSFYFYLNIRPKYIVSTGAHTSVPFCFIAKAFGSKVIFIESYAKIHSPTISGRLVYRIANKFYIQWESLKEFYPNAIYLGGLF